MINGQVYTAYVDGHLIETEPSGAVVRKRAVSGIDWLTVAEGRLFASGASMTSTTGPFVERIDPMTLRTLWRAQWPDVPTNDASYHGVTAPIVSASRDVLWVGVGTVLEQGQPPRADSPPASPPAHKVRNPRSRPTTEPGGSSPSVAR